MQASIPAVAEATLQVNQREVADVSVRTDAPEAEVAQQEVENQVEEMSTLLDLSPGPADSDDYDSAFESDTDF